ncbi:MAG: DUF481 domain-containing protein [Parafilimonas sp.]
MKKLKLSCILLCIIVGCHAQFNDTVQHYIRFASSGVINKTNNASSYVLNNNLNFNAQQKHINYNTSFNWIYGAQQKNLTNNDFNATGNVDINKRLHKLYYWGLITFDKSYSLNINYRLQAGAGLAYKIIDSPYLKINISDGFLYEKGNLIDADIGKNVYQTPRNSFRLTYHWTIYKRLQLDGLQFYQPSLLSIKDYIIQSDNTIAVKLNEWLSITGSLVYNVVSQTRRNNLLFTYGLTVEKYF